MSVPSYNVNELLSKLSKFGTYQKCNFLFISLAVAFSTVQYGYVFTSRSTKYRCFIPECEQLNATQNPSYHTPWMENAIPFDGRSFSKCERYASNTQNDKFCKSDSFNQSRIESCDKLVFNEGDVTIERDFNITCEKNLWKLTILGSLDELGEVLYMPFLGYLSDKYGRRTMFIASLIISSCCGIMKSFSKTYLDFCFLEFLSAFFTSGIYSAGFIIGVELLVPDQRVFGSTIIAIAFAIGEVYLGLAAWLSSSWRFMLRLIYIPGLLFITYLWIMDESLRFLCINRKEVQARQVIRRIAKTNHIDMPETYIICYDTSNEKNDEEITKTERETFVHLFRHPKLLLRILNCSLSWISCTFVYYGLTIYSVSLTGNLYLNFAIMAAIEIPAYIVCYYLLDKYGRRVLLGGSLLLSGVACLGVIFITDKNSVLQLVLPIFGKFAGTMAFKTIYIYTAEMFPTTLRHTLLAFCSMFGRAGAMAAPQLPLLASISPALPLVLFGFLGISAGLLAFFLPETTGIKLPDTIKEALDILR